ncbi:hypothetical protein GH733_001142 [Mirounga leonina]|nr:hypothetical protein GH733_001142 [Mirounga leonina]
MNRAPRLDSVVMGKVERTAISQCQPAPAHCQEASQPRFKAISFDYDTLYGFPSEVYVFGFAQIDQSDMTTFKFTLYYLALQALDVQKNHQKGSSQRKACYQGNRDQTGHTSTESLDNKLLCAQLMME